MSHASMSAPADAQHLTDTQLANLASHVNAGKMTLDQVFNMFGRDAMRGVGLAMVQSCENMRPNQMQSQSAEGRCVCSRTLPLAASVNFC